MPTTLHPKDFSQRALKKAKRMRLVDIRHIGTFRERAAIMEFFNFFHIDCVFDVGANVGQYAQRLRNQCGYRGLIVSFEPIPEMADRIRSLSENDPKWFVEELALGEEETTTTMYRALASTFSSLSEKNQEYVGPLSKFLDTKEVISVQVESLPTALHRLQERFAFSRPFLKLDTQGWDLTIVNAAKDVISNFVGIQSELAIQPLYESSVPIWKTLRAYEELGFIPLRFFEPEPFEFPGIIEMDAIFARRDLLNDFRHATSDS